MSYMVEVVVEQATEEDVACLCEAMLHDGLSRLLAGFLRLHAPLRQPLSKLATTMLTFRRDGMLLLVCEMPVDMRALQGNYPHLEQVMADMQPRAELVIYTTG